MKNNGANRLGCLVIVCGSLAVLGGPAQAGQSVTNLLTMDTELRSNKYTTSSTGNAFLSGTTGGEIYRGLIASHGPDIQDGYVLTNAVLRLYQDWTQGYNRSVNLFRVNTVWDQAVATWYTNVTASTWGAPGLQAGTDYETTAAATATTPGSNGFTDFNVTDEIRALLNGTVSSLSWLVRLPNETQLVRFRTLEHTDSAQRPRIVYQYAKQDVRGTVVTNAASADANIVNTSPDTPRGTGSTILVGYFTSETSVHRALIRMSLPEIPPAGIIESAQLRLYQDLAVTGYQEGGLIDLYRVLKPWSESSTWNSNAVDSAWSVPGLAAGSDYRPEPTDTSIMTLNQYNYFDVTEDVRAFVDGTVPNHGWVAIHQQESGNTLARFRTREEPTVAWRPALIVRYYIPHGTILSIR